jgi:Ser/Thr protein kinase RdoA (MazF antagonist)
MAAEKAIRALRALGLDAESHAAELAGSMSRSGVYGVRIDGRDAVLKVTNADEEQHTARRELAFYETLAEQVPVRTPRLLRHVDNDELTALVLSAHTPPPPARTWDRPTWIEVARQLAALHSIPPPEGDPWIHKPWLRQVVEHPPVRVAEKYWSRTDAADHLGDILDAPLGQALGALPDCFIHGDCHADNLLRDNNEIIWIDWQSAGIGSPAMDLAFLWGRAHSDSADPPRPEMLHEYATRRGVDADLLHRSLIAAELGTLLFGWPEYAHCHPRHERDRTTGRLIELIKTWTTVINRLK